MTMTQEEKELLLKDLSARLSYGVKISIPELWTNERKSEVLNEIFKGDDGLYRVNDKGMLIEYIKPYLFPLSSMTEEQYEKFIIISGWDGDIDDIRRGKFSCIGYIGLDYIYDTIDWFNKNHFDYRGLIPKGLAVEVTEENNPYK